MRKCGRSIISPEQDQYKHYCNDLWEYDEEITLAIEYIIKEAKTKDRRILLFGHSTALIKFRISQDLDGGWYGRSIHISNQGEWNFDLNKKPIDKVRLHGSFFSAVRTVQQDLIKKRISLKCPILFMCSNRSIKPTKTWHNEYAEADIVLNDVSMASTY